MPDHDLFEEILYAISTPNHKDYGKHLNHEEVRALVTPERKSTQAVLTWLSNCGVADADIEDNGEWINFRVSVAKAETMLGTKFHFYIQRSDKTRSKQIRTLKYSLPSSVFPHVSMIHPTTRFGHTKSMRSTIFSMEDSDENLIEAPTPISFLNATCNSTITPACLRALYNIGDYQADPDAGSLFGIGGYLKEYAKYDALESFLETFAPYAVDQNFTYSLINGGLATQNDIIDDDGEANLDMQYAASLGFDQDIVYYSTGGVGPLVPDLDEPIANASSNEPYLDFLDYILGLDDCDLPQTITTSYGENEQSVPEAFSGTVCDKFGQLGLRGVSVLFSSGDEGPGSACQTNDGKNTTRFLPVFPAACPYVTSVGGTRHVEPEAAVFFSSGGFSDRFPRPSYQDHAIKEYLDILGDRWKGLYNPKGRGFPDVAAQGYRFAIVDQNQTTFASGTSASSPAFAAVISLLNNARLSEGKKPLGFLNPWLYSVGKNGLNDIVHGGSTGCTGESEYSGLPAPFVPYAGWNATKGWDPVTGLGTPDFQKLLALTSPGFEMGHIES
ncbi:hypothetical protein EG329_009882 [Mollisiaceae sp. DMI_Dod_QoI]|nr:hypothetical protein EG329_009882 [Helotiales sp. DMI_Dod_QoI]